MLGKLKQKFVSWLLKGVHIDVLHIGEHSVVISGTGANMDGQKIENVGAPDSDDDVPRRDTIDSKIATHKGDASAHHAKTGDNEVYGLVLADLAANIPAAGVAGRWFFATDTLILSRDTGAAWVEMARGETAIRLAQLAEKAHGSLTGIGASDHHAKTTLFTDLTDRWTLAQAHRGADDKIMVFKGSEADPVEEDKPAGDMAKATYDPDADGKIALAQLVDAVCSETEADGKITTHKGDASAHHAKTGNYEVYANTELVTSLPGASSTYLGRILRQRAAAETKTTVYMCVQNDADGYEWIQIGIST